MIDPRYMTVTQWTDATVLLLSALGPMPKLINEKDWQAWALIILQIPAIASFCPPDPRGFKTWQEWASRFIQAVPL